MATAAAAAAFKRVPFGAAGLVSQTASAFAFDVLPSQVGFCVRDAELDREDRPNTAVCLSADIGDWASGRGSKSNGDFEHSGQVPGHGYLSWWEDFDD